MDTIRARALTVAAVLAALLLWYAMFSDDVERARAACVERGGQVLLQSDEQGIALAQYCVLPDGTRERL